MKRKKDLPKTRAIKEAKWEIAELCKAGDFRKLVSFQVATDEATRRTLKDCARLQNCGFNRAVIYAILKCFYNAFPNAGKFQRPRGGQWNKGPRYYDIDGKEKQTLYLNAGTADKFLRLAAFWGTNYKQTLKRALQSMRALLRNKATAYLARVKAKKEGLTTWGRAYLKAQLLKAGHLPGSINKLSTLELAEEWTRPPITEPRRALPGLSIYAPER